MQGHYNAEFGLLLGNAVEAAWLGFLEGLLALVVIVGIWQRAALRRFGHALREGFPRWQMLGGMVGATMIMGQAGTIPVLGVALFAVLLVSGQTLMSLVVDTWGLAPGGRRPVTGARVLGAVLTIVGIALAVAGRMHVGSLSIGLVLTVIGIGALLPFQFAFNAQVGRAARSPLVAALVNFTVGSLMLSGVLLIRGGGLVRPPSPLDNPGVWAAGLLGVFAVIVAALVVPTVGVLVFSLLMVCGQLVFSLLVDVAAGQVRVTGTLVAGVLVCVVAVIVASGAQTHVALPGAGRRP